MSAHEASFACLPTIDNETLRKTLFQALSPAADPMCFDFGGMRIYMTMTLVDSSYPVIDRRLLDERHTVLQLQPVILAGRKCNAVQRRGKSIFAFAKLLTAGLERLLASLTLGRLSLVCLRRRLRATMTGTEDLVTR